MDLSTIQPIEKEYNVQNPADGKPTGMIVTLACTHDPRVQQATRAIHDEIIKAGKDLSDEKAADLDNAMAAAYIVDVRFEGDAQWKGGTPKYSKELAKEICAITALKEQIQYEARKTRDFYKA